MLGLFIHVFIRRTYSNLFPEDDISAVDRYDFVNGVEIEVVSTPPEDNSNGESNNATNSTGPTSEIPRAKLTQIKVNKKFTWLYSFKVQHYY